MLQPRTRYSFEDYLAAEREELEARHEFIAGEVFAVTGATVNHNIIVANIIRELGLQMKGRPCLVFANDMRVRIEAADAATYPDLIGLCGEMQLHDKRHDVLLNPTLIIEVPSPSTEAYDRKEKFAIYRCLPSLREYLLVSQDQIAVELSVRRSDGSWSPTRYNDLDTVVTLASVGCRLALREVYDKVEL